MATREPPPRMDLAELIAGLDASLASPAAGPVRVCDVTDDSRTVVPGSLFIARRGTADDGRRYVPAALAAGAVAVLTDDPALRPPPRSGAAVVVTADLPACSARIAERFYGDPSSRLALVGVTGTNGKTTTSFLVHGLLNDAGLRCGLIGTVLIDDGRERAPATLTTPPATELSRTLACMVEAGCSAASMEVSSHALHQGRASGLRFRVGVFTNLTGDHLDYHGTMAAYAASKALLFAALPPDGLAVLNADDPAWTQMSAATRARVVRCRVSDAPGDAPNPDAEASASIVRSTMSGTRALFRGPFGELDLLMPLVGRFNVMNALQALVAAHFAGAPAAGLAASLAGAAAPPGRLEPVTRPGDPFSILVDYAHTDDALASVLAALRPLVPGRGRAGGGRLCVVFGCGGDRDRSKRPRMGAAAASGADLVWVTSDNPRREHPAAIIAEILAGISPADRARVTVEPDRAAAIRRAVAGARSGDIVLIAGKGHEGYQILPDGSGGTVTRAFDDRDIARAALRAGRAPA